MDAQRLTQVFCTTSPQQNCSIDMLKYEVKQCRRGTASGQVPLGVSLPAVNAVQCTVPASWTCCRCHSITNDWAERVLPLLFCMHKSFSKAQGLSRRQMLCSCAGAEHKPQTTATSEHNACKPKLESGKALHH